MMVGIDGGPLTPLDDLHRFRLPADQTYPILDLQTCISDLDTVIAIGEVLEEQAGAGTLDFGLWHALVITYGRGFQDGKSFGVGKPLAGLRQFLPSLDADQRQHHDHLLRTRNRQVAHTVDKGGAAITVAFHADGSFAAVDSFHVGQSASTADVEDAVCLARTLRELAWTERGRLIDLLEERWRGRSLSSEELAAAAKARTDFVAEVRASTDGPDGS
ncbi:hypothetical protein DY023_15760 [Microbacterium bovistercoris]|uniref:Uncharacterized protein n=2 Tax=Microbacterium bovistercoris TaxID=2293570 RepID=A0A371NQ93_9MICO|nr:hypothetical protein DY023_15760 [Microbacterium bovistercoris]